MKNIIKLLSFIMVFAFISCEPDEYAVPDIDKVPVYNITETGSNDLFEINVYQNNPLLSIWTNKGKVRVLATSAYADTSDDTNYMVSFTATEKVKVVDSEGVESVVVKSYDYTISGDKATGEGSMDITTVVDGVSDTVSYNMMIKTDTVYN
ncbi:MAG: hypothetical protein JEZ01_04970 [Labilibaculum sp.]|nr:hypothetical protein [Labilibaculum sp.]MBI9057101.1 hypothetical protein [Labilibaculum sp.]